MDKSKANITHRNDKEGTTSGKGMISPLGKTVPVVVLMAMNPALSNTAATKNNLQGEEGNPNTITMVSPSKTVEPEEATYVMFPKVDETQQNYPLGVAFFSDLNIQKIQPAIGNGVKANIVLTGSSTGIDGIYYVKHSYKDNSIVHMPPEITGLIYHNTGDGKEFMGIELYEVIYKDRTDKPSKIIEREVKIDDEAAQLLVDLLIGKTQWTNFNTLKFILPFRETTSPYLKEMKVY